MSWRNAEAETRCIIKDGVPSATEHAFESNVNFARRNTTIGKYFRSIFHFRCEIYFSRIQNVAPRALLQTSRFTFIMYEISICIRIPNVLRILNVSIFLRSQPECKSNFNWMQIEIDAILELFIIYTLSRRSHSTMQSFLGASLMTSSKSL